MSFTAGLKSKSLIWHPAPTRFTTQPSTVRPIPPPYAFFKSTFMWWKSSLSRLVADDIINEQTSLELFALLPSGRCYISLCTRTSRHKNSFPPCHLQSKQLTQGLWPVFCNSFSIFNYCLSLKYYVNIQVHLNKYEYGEKVIFFL